MTNQPTIIHGPNPNALTDEEMQEVATSLHALAMRVNGTPGETSVIVGLDDLPPVRRYLVQALHAEWQILQAAASNRTDEEGRRLVEDLEDFLRDHD